MGKYCPNCGAQLEDRALFCVKCGAKQPAPAVNTNEQPQQPNPIMNTNVPQQQPNPVINANVPQQQPNPVMNANVPPLQPNPVMNTSVPPYQQIPQGQVFTPPSMMPNTYGGMMPEKEFYKRFVLKNTRTSVTALAVICFITAVLSIVLSIVMLNVLEEESYGWIFDVIVYVTLGLILILKPHWAAALAVAIYSGLATAISLIMTGNVSGIIALFIAIQCVASLRRYSKAYNLYKTTGQFPQQMIK